MVLRGILAVFVWVGLFSGGSALAETVIPVLAKERAAVTNQHLRDLLEQEKSEVVDPDSDPSLRPFIEKAAGIMEEMIKGDTHPHPYQFVLVRDMVPNAFFVQLPDGTRVIGMHLGLLPYLKSDDALAFVLGHEIQHGYSELQTFVDRRQSSDPWDDTLLKRVIENEVDVKSVFYSVHGTGRNPYAGVDFVETMRAKFGEGAGSTHTSWNSRGDSIATAITLMKRVLGEEVLDDKPGNYRNEIVAPVTKYLASPAFKQGQLALARKAIQRPLDPDAIDRYQRVLAAKPPPDAQHPDHWGYVLREDYYAFGGAYRERLDATQKDTFDLLTLDEKMALEKEAIELTHADFLRLADDALPKLGSTLRYDQVTGLFSLENRPDSTEEMERSEKELVDLAKHRDEAKAKITGATNDLEREKAEKELQFWEPRARKEEQKLAELKHRVQLQKPLLADMERRREALIRHSVRSFFSFDLSQLMASLPMLDTLPKDERAALFPQVFERIVALRHQRKSGGYGSAGKNPYWKEYAEHDLVKAQYHFSRLYTGSATADRDLSAMLERFGKRELRDPTLRALVVPAMKKLVESALENDLIEELKKSVADAEKDLAAGKKEGQTLGTDFARDFLTLQKVFWVDVPEVEPGKASLDRFLARFSAEVLPAAASHLEKQFGFRPSDRDLVAYLLYHDDDRNHVAMEKVLANRYGLTREGVVDSMYRLMGDPVHGKQFHSKAVAGSYFPSAKYYEFIEKYADFKNLDSEHNGKVFALIAANEHVQVSRSTESKPVDHDFALSIRFHHWLRKNRPELFGLAKEVVNPHLGRGGMSMSSRIMGTPEEEAERKTWPAVDKDKALPVYREFRRSRFDESLAQKSSEPLQARYDHAFTELHKAYYDEWGAIPRQEIEKAGEDGLVVLNSFLKANARIDKHGNVDDDKELADDGKELLSAYLKRHPDASSRVDALGDTFLLLGKINGGPAPELDSVFEAVWKYTENRPDIRLKLAEKGAFKSLYYDHNLLKLSYWELNHRFQIDQKADALAKGLEVPPPHGQMRPVVQEATEVLKRQFPEPGHLRDRMVHYVGHFLRTNDAETDLLYANALHQKNWFENSALKLLDAPHLLNSYIDTNSRRMALLEFLSGRITEEEFFDRTKLLEMDLFGIAKQDVPAMVRGLVGKAARRYREVEPWVRSYILMPLLDARTGLFSEREYRDRVIEMVLGDHAKQPITRRLFESYLKAVPESEGKVIVSYILGTYPDNPGKRASIGQVLSAMGPLGIKAGQFLRTSGLAQGKLRDELQTFFSQALPPSRKEVLDRMRRVFGDRLVDVGAVHELKGSGSLNFAVVADIKNPQTGKPVRALVRFQRDYVEGQIRNENEIWERVSQDLMADKDTNVARLGRVIEESRSASMRTLGKGGDELDLRHEVDVYPDAKHAYERGVGGHSGTSIDVARPLGELNALIPGSERAKTAVFEYVDHVPLETLSAEKRRVLSQDFLEAEAIALFEKGVFDPDGHPGNWLYDSVHNRLVRIDYPQLVKMTEQERDAFRDLVSALSVPRPGKAEAARIAVHFDRLFMGRGAFSDQLQREMVLAALKDPHLPTTDSPLERIFFLRASLESQAQKIMPQASVRFRPAIQAGTASLSRIWIYSEEVGAKAATATLAKYLPVPKLKIAAQSAWDAVAGVVRDPAKLWRRPAPAPAPVESETIPLDELGHTSPAYRVSPRILMPGELPPECRNLVARLSRLR